MNSNSKKATSTGLRRHLVAILAVISMTGGLVTFAGGAEAAPRSAPVRTAPSASSLQVPQEQGATTTDRQALTLSATSAAAPHRRAIANCASYARNLFQVMRGNFAATINALRATPGCGATLASGVCTATRQWWGGAARALVLFITAGRYSTC